MAVQWVDGRLVRTLGEIDRAVRVLGRRLNRVR
jgi:hypothetical protein